MVPAIWKRPKIRRVLSDPCARVVVVEHRDRLALFGVEHLDEGSPEQRPRIEPRAARPRKVRKETAASAPLEKLIGWRPRPGTRAVLERRAELEGRSLTDLVQAAVDSYVQRKTAGVESLVRRELRKQLKVELRAVADAVSAQSVELTRQGSNLNQLSRFVNRYRELPVAITDELAASRAELAANRAALARLSAAVESLVGGGDR